MLKINSIVRVADSTRIKYLKIINFISKKNKIKSVISLSDLFLGVVSELTIFKKSKIRKKDKLTAILITVKKKYPKKNGIFLSFSQNRCIPIKITRFINPVASYLYTPVFFELKYLKKYKTLVRKSKTVF